MDQYQKVCALIKEGRNIFITGPGGTGKSYILNKLKIDYPNMVVTASTGAAAVNVGGTTIHSFSGIGIGDMTADEIVERLEERNQQWKIISCSMLAIDEISMINDRLLNLIDEVFRKIRSNSLPFGGVQVITIGDFCQLPPVQSDQDDGVDFAFASDAWEKANFAVVYLSKIYRQQDEDFLRILNGVRLGELSREDHIKIISNKTDRDDIIHLFARNKPSDEFNVRMLNRLPGRPYYFRGSDCGERKYIANIHKYCLAPLDLTLKIGAKVMLVINKDIGAGLINGSVGTVSQVKDNSILVAFDNGLDAWIERARVSPITIDKEVVAFRYQFPLRLAWAISIHKAQGMTLDNVKVDMSGIFESGQAYVALSRIKSIEGLYVKNFDRSTVKAHPRAVDFYRGYERIPNE